MAIDFALSSDQQAVAEVFGSFFEKECPTELVRAAEPLGHSPELWAKLVEMEVPSMALPAEEGGGGATMSDLVVVAEALGQALAPVPLIEHWVASRLLAGTGLLEGDEIAALSLRPADQEGRWRLVPGGAVAQVVVGVDGHELVALRSEPPMASPANHAAAPIADRSSRLGDRSLLGSADGLELALDEWRFLSASALVGLAQRAMSIAIAYTLERTAFGRPIGSFQSIQHGFADLPALIDGGRFLAHKAAWAHDSGLVAGAGTIDIDDGNIFELAPLASMAFLQAADAAAATTQKSLHYHGGYGFSLEYDIQLYFRRARGWANILGDPARERLRLAELLWPKEG